MSEELYEDVQNASARLGVSLGAVIRSCCANQLASGLDFDDVQRYESPVARKRHRRTRAQARAKELLGGDAE
jgi:hypothetical protein